MQNTKKRSDSKWRDVTTTQPCPICRKPDWCTVSSDGQIVHCRRSKGQAKVKGWDLVRTAKDKNGGNYTRWQSVERQGSDPETCQRTTRHAVYSMLLNTLRFEVEFAEQDEDCWIDLQCRGLSESEIRVRGYRYYGGKHPGLIERLAGLDQGNLADVPGFRLLPNSKKLEFRSPTGLLIPVRNIDGQIVAIKVRHVDRDGAAKYVYISSKKRGGASPGSPVHVPLHTKNLSTQTVRVTEGELKADVATALTNVLTLGVPGVASLCKTEPILQQLGAENVLLAVDADHRQNPQVAQSLVNAYELLCTNFDVEVETWPKKFGKGIDDLLAAGHEPKVLTGLAAQKYINNLRRKFKLKDVPRIQITVRPDEHRVNDEAVEALEHDLTLFKRGGILVRVVRDSKATDKIKRPKKHSRITALPIATLREKLTRVVDWWKQNEKFELVRSHPPKWAVDAIYARGEWASVRPLEGIVTGAVLRPDGSILSTRGYDVATGLICEPACSFSKISKRVSDAAVKAAVEQLRDAVADFPFESEVHFSAWLAFLLSMLARPAFEGPAPLFLLDANIRGSGKGLSCDVATTIAVGHKSPRTSNPRDDEEMRKRITAIAVAGDPIVLIDNISGTLGTPSLEAALTSDVWRDRILGRTEMVEMPLRPIWCATGNNVALTGDMVRRVVHIRLRSPLERPESRSEFKHPNILGWVRENRGQLLAAALTLLKGYCDAGRPDMKLIPWGSFEGWSDLVRNTIVWAGLADPADAREQLIAKADAETGALGALLSGIQLFDPEGAGLTASEMLSRINDPNTKNSEAAEMIREALGELCPPTTGGQPNTRSIGKRLQHLVERVVDGRFLDKRTRNHTSAWYVRNIETGFTGDKGGIPPTPHGKEKRKKADIEEEGKTTLKPRTPRTGSSRPETEVF